MQENILKHVILSIIPEFGVISQNRLLQLCGDVNNCFGYSFEELFQQDRARESGPRIGKKRLEIFTSQRSLQAETDRSADWKDCARSHYSACCCFTCFRVRLPADSSAATETETSENRLRQCKKIWNLPAEHA